MGQSKQNSIVDMMNQGKDLASRYKKILGRISHEHNFIPDETMLSKSQLWERPGKVGAIHFAGIITTESEKRRAVLKIQGVKPSISEADNIEEFQKQNKSNIIRPPLIYVHIPWVDEEQFEAFIMEEVDGKPVIVNHPASDEELNSFFKLYEEYRAKCFSKSWLKKPESYRYKENFDKWIAATDFAREKDRFKGRQDMKLAAEGVEILESQIKLADLEFMHGHFQPGDLIVIQSDQVVLFSNLLWGWRIPLYDAVFAYHWWMLGMEHAEDFSESLLEKERRRWLDKIYSLSTVKSRPDGERYLKLALLERAIPALMVDRYLMDQIKPSAEIVAKAARRELRNLVAELS